MSAKENLHRLIDQLSEEQLVELEQLTRAMMLSCPVKGKRCEPKSFDDARDAVFAKFDGALRNLAK